jgi:hypothetical protein
MKESYIRPACLIVSKPSVKEASCNEVTTPIIEQSKPLAYPIIQPLKAALYFDSAEGFGNWQILVSKTAEKHLREARRADAGMFEIYVKKIKCAHFILPYLVMSLIAFLGNSHRDIFLKIITSVWLGPIQRFRSTRLK